MRMIEIPKKELRDLYKKKKLTTYEIADIYNCCQATIWKRLHQFTIEARFPWNAVDLPKEKLNDWYTKKKLSTWEIEKQYGYPRGTVHRKLCEYDIKRRTSAAAHIIYPRKNFNRNKMDEAYLIGFAMGDLRVRKKYPNSETISIDCGSTKKEQINLITKLFKPYGRIWVSKPNKMGSTQIECSLNDSFNFLLKKRTLIEEWILKNKRFFWSFLAGFTDAEGCIAINSSRQAYYSLGNYNKDLLIQIRDYLNSHGVICSKLHESKTKGKLCFDKYFYNENYWQFGIYSKGSLLALFDLIGSFLKHSEKKKDMRIAKENIKLRNKRKK